MTISLFLLGAGLLSGCCTASHARKDPTFPVTPGHRYTVYVGDRQFVVDSCALKVIGWSWREAIQP
jgi:hypothetical protein